MKINKIRILAAGELLWDVFETGKRCGGATANIVYHAVMQGADARLCSAVGADENGTEILQVLAEHKLSREFVTENTYPTGTVTVKLTNGIPDYTIHAPVAWDFIAISKGEAEFAASADAFCFGSLAQRNEVSRKSIQELAKALPADALCVFDINLRQKFYSEELIRESLGYANVLKVSDEELPVLKKMFALPSEEHKALKALLEMFQLRFILYTLGAKGSVYFDAKQIVEQGIVSAGPVVDTVGCGDSFLASFLVAYLGGNTPAEAMRHAAVVSGYVAARQGAMPEDSAFVQAACLA